MSRMMTVFLDLSMFSLTEDQIRPLDVESLFFTRELESCSWAGVIEITKEGLEERSTGMKDLAWWLMRCFREKV